MTLYREVLFAYIDPGTGSIVLQIVLAAVLTAGVAFRRILMSPLMFLLGLATRRAGIEEQPESGAIAKPESSQE